MPEPIQWIACPVRAKGAPGSLRVNWKGKGRALMSTALTAAIKARGPLKCGTRADVPGQLCLSHAKDGYVMKSAESYSLGKVLEALKVPPGSYEVTAVDYAGADYVLNWKVQK